MHNKPQNQGSGLISSNRGAGSLPPATGLQKARVLLAGTSTCTITLPGVANFFFGGALPNRIFELPYIHVGYNKKTSVIPRAGVIRRIPEKSLAKVKGDVYKSLSSAVYPKF
jgi:hypothetical protein